MSTRCGRCEPEWLEEVAGRLGGPVFYQVDLLTLSDLFAWVSPDRRVYRAVRFPALVRVLSGEQVERALAAAPVRSFGRLGEEVTYVDVEVVP